MPAQTVRPEAPAAIRVSARLLRLCFFLVQTMSIYGKLPLKEITLNNFVRPESVTAGGLAALLPGIAAVSSVKK